MLALGKVKGIPVVTARDALARVSHLFTHLTAFKPWVVRDAVDLHLDEGESMTPEIIAIVAVGVALAGVILASARGVRQDMARLESRLDGRIDALESRMNTQLGGTP